MPYDILFLVETRVGRTNVKFWSRGVPKIDCNGSTSGNKTLVGIGYLFYLLAKDIGRRR